jgi:mannose-6-phosphate isomerase-like protein (cupin superfamily)/DNA-binding XRE family transcriptional regulator
MDDRRVLSESVGSRLRAHRERSGCSLRALSRKVGVSASLISQVEHGKAMPSVGTLYAIVSELEISFDELFRGAQPHAGANCGPRGVPGVDRHRLSSHWQAPGEGPVLRSVNRPSLVLATGVRWERLTASHDPGVEFLRCTYPIGGESAPVEALMTHEGSEYGIVLEGRCGATVGDDHYELEVGDSIAFDSSTPHRIWNLSEERPMLAIWTVIGRDNDPRVGG